jgi:hypothetical protein
MGGETPENVFFCPYFSDVEPIGIEVLDFA